MEYREYGNYYVYEDGTVQRISTGRILKPSFNVKGYHIYRIKRESGEWKTTPAHKIICTAWHGDPPDDGIYYEVDHIDMVRTNNHKDNLRWLTKSQNNQRTWNHNKKNNKGTKNGRCTLTEDQVKEICELIISGLTNKEIAVFCDTKHNIVSAIRGRRNWVWLTKDYKW